MRSRLSVLLLSLVMMAGATAAQSPSSFTVDQILGFPSPENLIASPAGSTIAWTFNERGARNIYIADGPEFAAVAIQRGPRTVAMLKKRTSQKFSSRRS